MTRTLTDILNPEPCDTMTLTGPATLDGYPTIALVLFACCWLMLW